MAKVKKDGIEKEIDNEGLVADYIQAGWELVKNEKNKEKNKGFMN